MAHLLWFPPVYMETSELTVDELVSPSSRILASFKAFLEFVIPVDEKGIIS